MSGLFNLRIYIDQLVEIEIVRFYCLWPSISSFAEAEVMKVMLDGVISEQIYL